MFARSLALLLVSTLAVSANWSNWRGPNFNGSTTASNLPTDLKANVKWELSTLPGASTPIVDDTQIYLTAVDPEKKQLVVFAVDRKTGKLVWEDRPHTGFTVPKGDPISLHNRSNYASPSAVTDGERVIFTFGNGDMHSYSLDGKKQWTRNLQKDLGVFTYQWTYSATPLLHKGIVYVPLLQRNLVAHKGLGKDGNESFLLAIDPATGKDMWKHIRPSKAQMESLEAFGTPLPYTENGREEIILFGGDVITGHDPKNGSELWRWGTWNPNHGEKWWRTVPSAVAGGGAVLACAPKKQPVYAAKTGLSGTHEGDDGKLWHSKDRAVSSDVPTPAFADGSFFVVSDVAKAISRVNPKSGKVEWSTELPGRHKWRASPTVADGKIWLMNHNSMVAIVDAKTGKLEKTEKLGADGDDNARATVAIAHNQIYVRTLNKLLCIGR
ncbi:MAG: outer membrane protein assembly factor BamB [Rhodothermales bacterium]|jgi:outer membrane protein assembly factor BamB